MNKLMMIALSVAATSLVGCASNQPTGDEQAQVAQAERTDGYRCTKEKRTGSRLPVRSCTTQAQRDQQKRDAETFVGNLNTTGAGRSGN